MHGDIPIVGSLWRTGATKHAMAGQGQPRCPGSAVCAMQSGTAQPVGMPYAHSSKRIESSERSRHGVCLGLEVSLIKLFQSGFLQLSPSQQSFQRGVLLLEVLQPFSFIGFHTTVLVAPPIIGLLSNLELAAYISHGAALTQKAICLAKFADNLFRRMAFFLLTHRVVHSPRKLGGYGLTYRLGLKNGVRPGTFGRILWFALLIVPMREGIPTFSRDDWGGTSLCFCGASSRKFELARRNGTS